MPVGHADLRHVGPPDVVAVGAVLQVVLSQEVLLLLYRRTQRERWCSVLDCTLQKNFATLTS